MAAKSPVCKIARSSIVILRFYLAFDFPTKDMIENGENFYEARGKRYIVISL